MNSKIKYLLNKNSNLIVNQNFCSKSNSCPFVKLEKHPKIGNNLLRNKKISSKNETNNFLVINNFCSKRNLWTLPEISNLARNFCAKNKMKSNFFVRQNFGSNCNLWTYNIKHEKQLKVSSNLLETQKYGSKKNSNSLVSQNCYSKPNVKDETVKIKNNFLVIKNVCSKRNFCTLPDIKHEKPAHIPVMAQEVLEAFKPKKNQIFLDMTFGAGGHTTHILNSAPNIKILALDRDPLAHEYAKDLSKTYPQITPLLGRFSELPELLKQHKIKQNSIDGILFDFGCSSMQFDIAQRGFSVSKDGPLDMRMDGNRFPDMPTAADLLAFTDEEDIAKILKVYGEEKQAKKIARAIIEARYTFKRLKTTQELADLVDSVLCDEIRTDKLNRSAHNATKTFQALRIFVNNEVNEINYGMLLAQKYLKIGGRLVTITFHSLEDTIVKRHLLGNMIENAANPIPLKYSSHMSYLDRGMVDQAMDSCWEMLHKHVLIPSFEEVDMNPRSRSAKMRVAVKIK